MKKFKIIKKELVVMTADEFKEMRDEVHSLLWELDMGVGSLEVLCDKNDTFVRDQLDQMRKSLMKFDKYYIEKFVNEES